ncbi:MAG: alpha/beta fold hydrolase, partial [Puniceicoccaceae bacterium]
RIPVVLVHGLISTPGMWKNLVNELQADPDIGKHYRFYVYTYPTSLEPAHSARLLRDTIAEKKNRRKPAQGYLLISHSMGGILSRAQSTEIGRHAWDAQFGNRSEQAWRKTQEDDFVRQMLVFDPDPDIRRLIFIAVPHQGSPMATRQPARILARFIRPPVETTRYLLSSPLVAAGLMDPQAKPTSADGLSPSSPFLQAMADLPTVSPAHSIIGDRGKPGELEMSSDGVVPYWSSHLPFAESERVVPAGHSAYRDAEAIREVMRILREDLRQRPPAGQTQASLTPLNASNPLADADGRNER